MVEAPLAHQTRADRPVGVQLKETRLQRKKTLDEIATVLRIPPQHLRSLEEGKLSIFCAEVYAKGAYMKYASYLGINSRDAWHAFLRSLAGARRHVPRLAIPIPATWLHRFLTPSGVLLLVLAMAVALVGGYIALQINSFVKLPALAVLEPSSPILTGQAIVVRGSAEAEAEVSVNEEPVWLNDQNRWEFVLPLHAGINILQVEAKGTSGRTKVVNRHLLVPKSE